MKVYPWVLLIVASLIFTPGLAQSSEEELAIIVITGQNKNRTVAGSVNEECGGDGHSAPFGNWGVSSNYGDINDTWQFRGWSWQDGDIKKLQWNSCTTAVEEFHAPNCSYYNRNGCTTQGSDSTVTHGTMNFRTTATRCPLDELSTLEEGPGCRVYEGARAVQNINFMTLYELDWNGNDLVETLYFPRTSLTLSGCTRDGCPEKRTGWLSKTRDTSPPAETNAKFRMTARAVLVGYCDWN